MDMLNNAKDEMALRLFGRSRTIALAGNQCVKCGEFGNEFRDALSRKEFGKECRNIDCSVDSCIRRASFPCEGGTYYTGCSF